MVAMLAQQLDLLHLEIVESIDRVLANLNTESLIIKEVKNFQKTNLAIMELKDKIEQGWLQTSK